MKSSSEKHPAGSSVNSVFRGGGDRKILTGFYNDGARENIFGGIHK